MSTDYKDLLPKLDKGHYKIMENVTDEEVDKEIEQVVDAIRLFLDSKVNEAEKACRSLYGKTLIHTHGTSVLAVLKAIMTFDSADIEFAMNSLRQDVEASSSLRKEQSIITSFSSMIFGNNQKNKLDAFKSMNIIQKHAEITFAESYLLKALLSIVTDSNMVTFMKEGLAIRHSYSIYKTCYKFLKTTIKEGGPEALREYKIDSRFITSVYLGMGCFNLMLSIMPPRILKLFEMIGLGGNREFGMQCLALGAEWKVDEACCIVATDVRQKSAVNFFVNELTPETEPGSRRFLCEMVLLSYHIILTTMIQLPNCNFPLAVKMLEKCISAHPNSSIYLIFKGKVSQSQRRISTAIADFKKVIELQSDWRQLIHVCFWELGICHAAIGKWEKAAHYFDILYKENPWSKSIYLYLKAMMLYTFDSQKHKEIICESLKEIPKLLKKVAGKSIPLEKFVARKARKYFIQNERLLLPALEIMYMWNGFDLIPDENLNQIALNIDVILENLDKQLEEHTKTNPSERVPYSTFYDDFCLARFFKGIATRELVTPSADNLVPERELLNLTLTDEQLSKLEYAQRQLEYIGLQADDIEYEHWILPFARYELGRMHMRMGNYEKSRGEFQAALNGGYADNEAGAQKRKASMESVLHLRIHNALMKLRLLESLKRVDGQDESESSDKD